MTVEERAIQYLEAIIKDIEGGQKVCERVTTNHGKTYLMEKKGPLFGVDAISIEVKEG